jgi:hypothetical protein
VQAADDPRGRRRARQAVDLEADEAAAVEEVVAAADRAVVDLRVGVVEATQSGDDARRRDLASASAGEDRCRERSIPGIRGAH